MELFRLKIRNSNFFILKNKYKEKRINNNYYLDLHVFNPKIIYSGQKLIKLVKRNTAATMSKTIPNVPVITLVKNKIPIINAIIMRIVLSTVPMFFFIVQLF